MRSSYGAGSAVALATFAIVIALTSSTTASAQSSREVYTGQVIASEGLAGSSARIRVRIDSHTTEQEKAGLERAFKKDAEAGMFLISTMTKGVVTLESEAGRPIHAVFMRETREGSELVIVFEHIASKLQAWKMTEPAGANVAVIHLRLGPEGVPESGEIFPAVKLSLGPDNLIDAQTTDNNKIIMTTLARR